MQVFETNQQ